MTRLPLLAIAALCACVHQPNLALTGVEMTLKPGCIPAAGSQEKLAIQIRNGSDRNIGFPVSGPQGPPYVLHPTNYEVYEERPDGSYEWSVDCFCHYHAPPNQVRLDPGDTATFILDLGRPDPTDTKHFKVEVEDTYRRLYRSEPVTVCASPS